MYIIIAGTIGPRFWNLFLLYISIVLVLVLVQFLYCTHPAEKVSIN